MDSGSLLFFLVRIATDGSMCYNDFFLVKEILSIGKAHLSLHTP